MTRLGLSLVRRGSALWLGADELVQIDTVFWTEKTRRFAYADIHALLLRETPRGLILSAVFGGLAAVLADLSRGAWKTRRRAASSRRGGDVFLSC